MEQYIRVLFAIVILVHGLGHLIGIHFISDSINFQGFGNNSWILTDQLGLQKIYSQIVALLWIVATFGFLFVTYGFWTNQDWWKPLSGLFILVSIGLFALWWTAFPNMFPYQANIGNLVIILGLIFIN